jgi:hypothetical protein
VLFEHALGDDSKVMTMLREQLNLALRFTLAGENGTLS